jgi:hypothetical protein
VVRIPSVNERLGDGVPPSGELAMSVGLTASNIQSTGGFTECKIQVASVTSCHPVVSARMNPGDF